jgi:flagellar biosynthesis GTPase FlhF
MIGSIEARNYVATEQDVVELIKARCGAGDLISTTREVYLKILIASAQQQLNLDITSLRGRRLVTDETIAEHVKVVDKLHEGFYKAMTETVRQLPVSPDDKREKNVIVNARCAFARSSYSTLRNWMVRGRHTLKDVVAKHANKMTMYEQTPRREMSATQQLGKRKLISATEKILEQVLVAAKTDRQAAIDALHDVIIALSRGFDDLGIDGGELRTSLDHTATGVIHQMATHLRRAA